MNINIFMNAFVSLQTWILSLFCSWEGIWKTVHEHFCGHACSCCFCILQIAEVGSVLRLYIM